MVFLGQIHVHAMITTVLVCFIQMKCGALPVALLSSVACELAPLKIVFFFLFLPLFLYV